jgi:hypothetical protein
MEVRAPDGRVFGSRNAVDENGRITPLHPRPAHSYRGARRIMARQVYRTLRKEAAAQRAVLVAEAELAYLQTLGRAAG